MSKIALSGNASGTGTLTLAAPNTNSDRTLTLPDNSGTLLSSVSAVARTQLPAGTVLQVVQATRTAIFSTTSTSLVDSGFSASITPTSATSKVLMLFNGRFYLSSAGAEGTASIYRSGTPIWTGFTVYNSAGLIAVQQSAVLLDSPATTSATTYALYMKLSGGGSFMLAPNSATDGISTITLMEIAA